MRLRCDNRDAPVWRIRLEGGEPLVDLAGDAPHRGLHLFGGSDGIGVLQEVPGALDIGHPASLA